MKKLFFLIFVMSTCHCLYGSDNVEIGYIENSYYYPFLTIDRHGKLKRTSIVKRSYLKVYNTFQISDSDVVEIMEWRNDIDVYTKESYFYGKVKDINESKKFYCNKKGFLQSKKKKDELVKSFYDYFSKDNWGKHLITPQLLSKSIDEIEKKSGVKVVRVTDTDNDGKEEVWILYNLKYDRLGRMVFEKTECDWKLIVNSCINCD